MNNVVIDGDYKHFQILISKDSGNLVLEGSQASVELSKDTICRYDIIHIEYNKNIFDIIARAIIGLYALGYIGILAIFTASNTYESYRLVNIEFKDGKNSRIKIKKKQFKQLLEVV